MAAVDPVAEQTAFFQDTFGFTKAYGSLQEALADGRVDIVSIASPPVAHLGQIFDATSSNAAVLCEKPLVVTESDCARMRRLLGDYAPTFGVMLPRRYYNASVAVKQVLDEGKLGEIEAVTLDLECCKESSYYETWRGRQAIAGGGVLMSQAIHSIDQLVFFFGPPDSVHGRVHTRRAHVDVEDEAEAMIRFADGSSAKITATNNSKDVVWQGITTIRGSAGVIELDSERVVRWEVPDLPPPVAEERENVPTEIKPAYYGPGHKKVIVDFIDAVEAKKQTRAGGIDSLTAVSIILGIYESSESGESVHLSNYAESGNLPSERD